MNKSLQFLKNPQVWGFFVSMAVMAVISLAFFAPNNFDGASLAQHDMQQGAANGEEGRAYAEQTDEKALWTNSLFSGMPTFQISPEYPSNSLFTWINDVYGLGLPSPSNLLFMMMLGMLIMCYCMRMRWWYALIAAVGWGLSSYFVIIIGAGHIWKFLTLTYVPPTIGGMILAYRGRPLWGGSLLALFAMLQLNANHPQITYYSAYIMASLAVFFLIWAIRKKTIRTWLAATAACLIGGALALGANAPSLYNTYEYAKETKRAQSELAEPAPEAAADNAERPTGGLPKAEIGGWSNTPSESFSLLVPNIKGGASIHPRQGRNEGMYLADLNEYQSNYNMQQTDIFGLIPQLSQYFGGKGMTNGPFYLGALLCALFLLGCLIVRGPVKWALLTVTLFSILLAMGNHFEALTDFMIYNVPLYNKFRAAETALVIAALCVPLLGGLALQQLFSNRDRLTRYQYISIAVAFGVPALICLVAWLMPSAFGSAFTADEAAAIDQMRQAAAQYGADAQIAFDDSLNNITDLRMGLVSADGLRSLLILIAGAAIVLFTVMRKQPAWLGALGVGVIVLIDLYNVDKRYVDDENFVAADLFSSDAPIRPDAIDLKIMEDKGYYRVADLQAFGDARRSYFHHMTGGYHAAKLNRYNDLIEHRMQTAIGIATQQNLYLPEVREDSIVAQASPEEQAVMRRLAADYRVLDMLNARYIITRQGLEKNPYAAGPAWMAHNLQYVDNARAEMDALAVIDPTAVAVADRRFADILGADVPSVVPGDTVILKEYTPNRLTYDVSTRNGGVAVFSEIYFPWGWHATIDGKEATLGRVNYVLRALRVPAGQHEVVMIFDPDSLHTTGTIAYICVTIIYLMLALSLFAAYVAANGWNRKTHRK